MTMAVVLGWKARLDLGVAELSGVRILGDHVAEEVVGGNASVDSANVRAFRIWGCHNCLFPYSFTEGLCLTEQLRSTTGNG